MDTCGISVRHAEDLKQTNVNEFGEHTLIDSEETGATETDTDNAETGTNHVETSTDTLSVVCPAFQPQITSIEGLYRVPDQC